MKLKVNLMMKRNDDADDDDDKSNPIIDYIVL